MMRMTIGTAMALAALAATPALAKSTHRQTAAEQSYGASEPFTPEESGLTTRGPAIYSNGQYAGWDPDPNIRFQLLRDPGPEGN